MNRLTLALAVIILLLGAIAGTVAGLLNGQEGGVWPVVCVVEGDAATCVMATITPVVWDAETAAAVATWEAGRPAPAP